MPTRTSYSKRRRWLALSLGAGLAAAAVTAWITPIFAFFSDHPALDAGGLPAFLLMAPGYVVSVVLAGGIDNGFGNPIDPVIAFFVSGALWGTVLFVARTLGARAWTGLRRAAGRGA